MGIGDPDAFDKLLYLNLSSPIRLTRVLAPAMAKSADDANIINISSVAGRPHQKYSLNIAIGSLWNAFSLNLAIGLLWNAYESCMLT